MRQLSAALCVGVIACARGYDVVYVDAAGQQWPQCWRFEKMDTDSLPLLRAALPLRLFPDGRASFFVDSIGRPSDPRDVGSATWSDGEEGRRIASEATGFWGHFVTVSNPFDSVSAGVERGYTDFGPYYNWEIDIRAFRFPCSEGTWYPPR